MGLLGVERSHGNGWTLAQYEQTAAIALLPAMAIHTYPHMHHSDELCIAELSNTFSYGKKLAIFRPSARQYFVYACCFSAPAQYGMLLLLHSLCHAIGKLKISIKLNSNLWIRAETRNAIVQYKH